MGSKWPITTHVRLQTPSTHLYVSFGPRSGHLDPWHMGETMLQSPKHPKNCKQVAPFFVTQRPPTRTKPNGRGHIMMEYHATTLYTLFKLKSDPRKPCQGLPTCIWNGPCMPTKLHSLGALLGHRPGPNQTQGEILWHIYILYTIIYHLKSNPTPGNQVYTLLTHINTPKTGKNCTPLR
jgi:hypothetical protein